MVYPKPIHHGVGIEAGSSILIGVGGDLAQSFNQNLENEAVGSDFDMIKDGSAVPVVFSVSADPTDDIILSELRIVAVANDFLFDGATFGKGSGALANGLLVEGTVNDGQDIEPFNMLINEDLLKFFTKVLNTEFSGINNIITASSNLSGARLVAGSGDKLKTTVRDNIADGSRDFKFLEMVMLGFKPTM